MEMSSTFQLLMFIGLPLCCYTEATLVVTPNRTQHFRSHFLSVSCEGQDNSTRWSPRWKAEAVNVSGCPQGWRSEAGSTCSIRHPAAYNSGLYLCKSESGEYSQAVAITVTDGLVILESPVRPVFGGDPLTLRCLSRNGSSIIRADFYKDGFLLQAQTTGEMTIPAASKAHEGFYQCRHPELGASPESWIAVIIRNGDSLLSVRPRLSILPRYLAAEGDSVTLSCAVNDTSLDWTFIWYRVGSYREDLPLVQYRLNHYSAELLSDSSRGAGGSYNIISVALKHTGLYACRAEGGEPTSQTDLSYVRHLGVIGLSPLASLVVRPNRTQHFRSESLSLSCEAQDSSTRWRLRWHTRIAEGSARPDWWKSEAASNCSIREPYEYHSGVYWCEAESGQCSSAVNIIVTQGLVILESPTQAVTELDPLTLRCLSRNGSSIRADFYKDGFLLQANTTGEMTIPAASKAHEGFYHCRHPELGASPKSWIAVIKSPSLVLRLVSSLMVAYPYLLVTILLVVGCFKSKCRSRVDENERKYEVSEAADKRLCVCMCVCVCVCVCLCIYVYTHLAITEVLY